METNSVEEAARIARDSFATVLIGLGFWEIYATEEVKEERLKLITEICKMIGNEAVKRIGMPRVL